MRFAAMRFAYFSKMQSRQLSRFCGLNIFVSTFSNKMHSGATIVRFEPAEDEWCAEWRHRDVGDSSFIFETNETAST